MLIRNDSESSTDLQWYNMDNLRLTIIIRRSERFDRLEWGRVLQTYNTYSGSVLPRIHNTK